MYCIFNATSLVMFNDFVWTMFCNTVTRIIVQSLSLKVYLEHKIDVHLFTFIYCLFFLELQANNVMGTCCTD